MLSVIAGIVAAAARNPAAPALITGRQSIAYGELLDAVARVSNYLVSRGLAPRSKLFLNIAAPDVRLIVTLAAMHAGFIPFVLLEIGDLAEQVDYDFVVGAAVPHLPDIAADVMIDQPAIAGKLSDGSLRDYPEPPDDAVVFVAATSGSTGRPKLVAETYLSFRVRSQQRGTVPGEGDLALEPWYGLAHGDRLLCTLGDATAAGLLAAVQVLAVGATLLRNNRDRRETIRAVNLYGVNRIKTTPGTLGELMDAMDGAGLTCPSVRRILLVGGLLDQPLLARIGQHFDAEVSIAYGATEVGRISGGVIDPMKFEPGYVGELFPEMKIVSNGTRGDPAPLTAVRGEGSAFVAYYVNGKAVSASGPFYTLPDLGFIEDGRVYLVGRDDEVLNISGNKVAYSVIDQALRNMAGIRDIAIVSAAAVGDPTGIIIGVVGGGDVDLSLLADRVHAIIKAPGMAEHIRLFRLAEVPRNAFGKTDRSRVVAAFRHQAGAHGNA